MVVSDSGCRQHSSWRPFMKLFSVYPRGGSRHTHTDSFVIGVLFHVFSHHIIVSFSHFPHSSAASGLVILHLIDSSHLLASHELTTYPLHSHILWTHCIFFTFLSCLHSLLSHSQGFLLHLSSLSCQALDPMLSHWCVLVFSVPMFC